MPTWDADLYLRFANERTQPSIDLAARVPVPAPQRIVDLGCGPGNSTEVLHRRWPDAAITGVDSSPDMIAAATKAHPWGRWLLGDLATWAEPEGFDVVFSNAALQWVPDHRTVFPHLMSLVRPAGVLAVQMPRHIQSPLHQLMLRLADEPQWRDAMTHARTAVQVETPGFYYDVLRPLAQHVEMWETEYLHVLADADAIVGWIRGTGLRPFLEALPDDAARQSFERRLRDGVALAYPPQADGRVIFPFRRLFVIGTRGG